MTQWRALHGQAFEGQRVLVTGAAGFIGSHLAEALVELGAEVVGIDNLCGGDWANIKGFDSRVRTITADILDTDAIHQATKGVRYVFHQAALGSVPRSVREPERYHQNNILGTLAVLQAARHAKVQRVIYAGSSSAYGDPPGVDLKDESLPPDPKSPYAVTKLAGEYQMRAWACSYGVDTAITRYFNIFGPRQNANSAYAAVIAAFAKALFTGTRPIIFGDGEQSRDFTFVHNAVHANLLAARHAHPLEGQMFNIATSNRVTVNQLLQTMYQITGRDPVAVDFQPPRAGEVRHSLADITKARNVLGYQPQVDFQTGLGLTVDWYGQQFTDIS